VSVRVGFWGRLGGLDGVSFGVEGSLAGVGSGVGGCVGSGMSRSTSGDHTEGGRVKMGRGHRKCGKNERVQGKEKSSNRGRCQTRPPRRQGGAVMRSTG
jgi:hypothetical protein